VFGHRPNFSLFTLSEDCSQRTLEMVDAVPTNLFKKGMIARVQEFPGGMKKSGDHFFEAVSVFSLIASMRPPSFIRT